LGDSPHLSDPSSVVRSDPADLPIGAQRRRIPFPDAPPEARDPHKLTHTPGASSSSAPRQAQSMYQPTARRDKRARQQSVVQLLLEELEDRVPSLGNLRNLSMELRPAFPSPAMFGLVWCLTIYATAVVSRRVIVAVNVLDPQTVRYMIQNPMLLKYLGHSWSWILLMAAGVSVGATVRNMYDRFTPTFPLAMVSRLLGIGAVVVLTLTGQGMEFALGAWVGTYVQLVIGCRPRTSNSEAPKPKQSVAREPQSNFLGSPWAYRRWD